MKKIIIAICLIGLLVPLSCGLVTKAQTQTISVRCTSPEPGGKRSILCHPTGVCDTTITPSELDRIVILSYSEPITEDNVLLATPAVFHTTPSPTGELNVITDVPYDLGQWLAAVSYNKADPDLRSLVSNTIQLYRPEAIADLGF